MSASYYPRQLRLRSWDPWSHCCARLLLMACPGKKHNPANDELIGQGIGNIMLRRCLVVYRATGIARTAASVNRGGKPASCISYPCIIHTYQHMLLAPVLSYIPMASMAALLLMVAWNMSEAKHFIRTIRIAPRDDVVVLLLCFSLTVLFDMTIAVAVGMGLAAMLFITKKRRVWPSLLPLSTTVKGISYRKVSLFMT